MRILLGFLLAVMIGAPAALANDEDFDLPEKEESRQTYTLQSGATVRLLDISGSAEVITTASGNDAEVHIVRSARKRADLEHHKISVNHTPNSLEVRSSNEGWKGWGNHEVRQRITLKVPRSVSLEIRDISGKVVAGVVDGSLTVADVSGKVIVQGADGDCSVTDVSGKVSVNLLHLGSSGLRIADVSGVVDLGLPNGVNADISVRDVSGRVSTDVDGLSIRSKGDGDEFDGALGSGGPAISITDVSGRVRLSNGPVRE